MSYKYKVQLQNKMCDRILYICHLISYTFKLVGYKGVKKSRFHIRDTVFLKEKEAISGFSGLL